MKTVDLREMLVVLLLTIVGAVLRFWSFGALELSHFDEGVYALTGLWATTPSGISAIDPGLIPYAPPGESVLIGISYSVFGVSDLSAIFVSSFCGVLCIPATAWLGRRTFGPGAGAAAAALVTFSVAHLAFSRKALTDVPFLLLWTLALGLGGRFLERPNPGRALALGLGVGLAQNFKYNGWLAGAIVAATALVGFIRWPEQRRSGLIARTFGWGALSALVACVLYLPWFWFVEQHGGYGSLLRHQRGYFGGPSHWWPNWNQQLGQVRALAGGWTWRLGTWVACFIGTGFVMLRTDHSPSSSENNRGFFFATSFSGALVFAVLTSAPWWIGLAFAPLLFSSARTAERLIVTTWASMSMLTPLYHPYARLWLPLHACGWILVAGLAVRLFAIAARPSSEKVEPERKLIKRIVIVWSVSFIMALLQERPPSPEPFPLGWYFRPSPSFRSMVFEKLAGPTYPLRVLARRPLVFYLLRQGKRRILLEPDVKSLAVPSGPDQKLLIDETILHGGESALAPLLRRWVVETTYIENLDPVTLLDVNPDSINQKSPIRDYRIWLLSAARPSGRGNATSR